MSLLNEILSKAKQVGGKVIDYLDGDNAPTPVAPIAPVKKVSILDEVSKQKAIDSLKTIPKYQVPEQKPTDLYSTKKTSVTDVSASLKIGTNQLLQSGANLLSWAWNKLKKNVAEDVEWLPNIVEGLTDKAGNYLAGKLIDIGNTKKFEYTISDIASNYSKNAKEYSGKDFEYKDVITPSFWTVSVAQQVPTLVAYAATGSYISQLKNLGPLGKILLWGTVSRMTESVQNSSDTFKSVLDSTGDVDKANTAAIDVFKDNAKLLFTEPLQFAADFLPGKWALKKTAWFLFSATSEVGEELYTTYAQNNAQRRAEWKKEQTFGELVNSPEGKNVIATSLALWGGGNIVASYGTHAGYNQDEEAIEDAKKNLTPEQKDAFDEWFDEWEIKAREQLTEIKELIETPEEEKIIKGALSKWQLSLFENIEIDKTPIQNQNITEKNIAQFQNNISQATPETRTNIIVRALKSFGYKVKTSKSSKSDSEYLTVSNKWVEWGVETTIRLSDHKLPQKYSSKQKKKDFEIDKNSADPFPFNDVISKMNGGNVKQGNFEKYKASADVQKFERAMKNMENEEIADYMSGSDQAVYDAGGLELTSRGVSADELTAYLENATPKKYERPRKSIMDEVREGATIDMTWATDENLRAKSFGFTYDPQGWALYQSGWKTDGIVVTPFPNRSDFIPWTMDEISFWVEFEIYVQKNMDLIKQGLKAWGWYSESRGWLVFDVGIVLPTEFRAFAEKLGKDTNQEGIFNLFDTNEDTAYIPTGGDGKTPQNFDENAIFDIIRPYISKQPSYDTISPTNGISWPIENEQGTNSGNLTTDVSTDNVGSTTAEVALNPDDFQLSKGLSKGMPRYKTFTIDFRNDLNRALYIIRDSRWARSASDDLYLQEVMEFTGLSEQEARTLGDTVNNNLKKNEKNAINGVITLDDNLINLNAQEAKVAIDELPDTAPFTGEDIKETAQYLYEQRDSEKLIEQFGEAGIFTVQQDNQVEGFTDARIIKMSPDEYAATKLPKLKDWEVAYKIYTPFTETIETGDIILKPGVSGSKWNFARAIVQSFVWSAYGDTISSLVTMSKRTTVPLLKFFWVKNILGLLVDTKTGYSWLQLEGVESNKKVTNRIWYRDKFWITKLQEALFAKEKEFAEAWKALAPKIEGIIANNDTVNTLTGQTVTAEKIPSGFKSWNEYIEFLEDTPGNEDAIKRINDYLERVQNWTGSIKAKVIANERYNSLSEFSPSKRETLKKYEAISHMYFYYPKAMREILSPEIIELLRNNLDYSKTQIAEATDFWGKVLVQKGNLRPEDLEGARRTFVTVEEINEQNPVIPSEELAYERYMVNINDVRNAISEEIDERFDSPEHYIDYLKVIRNAGATQTDLWIDIDTEIKRLEDSILRSKKGDQLDFYRSKAPLAQIIDYSGHLSNTIYQDNMMKVFSALEKNLPWNLKTKRTFYGTAVGVLQDAFWADIRRRDLTDRQKDIMLYGKSKTTKFEAAKASFINKAGALAAFWFSGIDNIFQAWVVVAMLFPHPKAHATKFEWRNTFEQFFIENGIGNVAATEEGKFNNTMARVREQAVKNQTFIDTVATQDNKGNLKLYNTGNLLLQYASLQPMILFGNTLETYTSRSSAMYFMTEQVEKVSGKKLINGLTIDAKEVLSAFKELTVEQQQTIIDETDKRIQRNFSTTNTRSSIGFMRWTEFNVLRWWTTKFLSAHLIRTVDTRSYMANMTSKALRELYSDPEVKAMNKQYKDSASLISQYAAGILATQALVAWALYAIAALDEDDDKEESLLTSWLIARKWVFSGILDLDGMLIRQIASPVSTSFGYTYELAASALDYAEASLLDDNKFAQEDARRRFVKAFWGIGQIVNYANDAGKTIENWSTFWNLNYVQKGTPGHFALNEMLPGNFEYAKASAIEFQMKNAKDNGLMFMLDMFGDMVGMRMFQAQIWFQQMFGPLAKTATGKKAEAFKKAWVWDAYNTYVKNHGDEGSLNEVTLQFFNAYPLEYLSKEDIKVMNNINDYAKARSNESIKMAKSWNDMKFLEQRWFSYARGEAATTTLNRIKENPELTAAFYERIFGLTTKTSDELELKKYLESALSTPNARSSTWSALSLIEENNRYENRLKRNMNTFFYDPEASEGDKWYDNVVAFVEDPTSIGKQKTTGKSIDSSKAMLDSMEAMLAFASSNTMVEKAVLESIQSVIAKNGKQRVYSLFEKGLANPADYPEVMKAWVQLQDDSTASYSETIKDSQYDYEVYGHVGKKPTKEEVKIPTSYEEWDTIKSPYYWVVQVNKKWNIVIKDILGRSFVFTNIDTDKKVGDVLDPGAKIWVVKKWGTETNRFNKMNEAQKTSNDLAPLLKPDGIFSPSYLKTLGIDPIDFYALADSIKAKWTKKKKTSPKKSKSILEEVISLQPKKSNLSIMQEIISKQTTK